MASFQECCILLFFHVSCLWQMNDSNVVILSLMSTDLSVRLPICQSTYLPIYLSVNLPICLSTYLSIYLFFYLFTIHLAICQSTYLSIYLSVYLSIYLSTYLSIYLSILLSVNLSVSVFMYLSLGSDISVSEVCVCGCISA